MKVLTSYTRLLVSDLEACFIFYRDVMKFEVAVEDVNNGYAEFIAGNMKLALFRRQEMAEMIGNDHKPFHAECQDRVLFIFAVRDLSEVYQELKHQSVEFTTQPLSNPAYGIKTVYLRDPDGNLIGLFQQIL